MPSAPKNVNRVAPEDWQPKPKEPEAVVVEIKESVTSEAYWNRHDNALGCLKKDNCLRTRVGSLVRHPRFEAFILTSIILNSLLMALERPGIDPEGFERWLLELSSLVFAAVFSVEFFLKVIDGGLCIGPWAYFKDSWNRLDGSLVFISWIDLLLTYVINEDSSFVRMLRVLRMLRAMRPLRSISRIPSLQTVVRTILASVEPIGQLCMLILVIFTVFGILGVQLFAGKFYYCSGGNSTVVDRAGCDTYCEDKEGCQWINNSMNFDNIFNSVLAIFYLCTGDGWMTIMYLGIDAVGVDMQPQRDYNMSAVVFFLAVVLVGQFILLNMFIGVVVDSYARQSVIVGTAEPGALDDADDDDEAAALAKQEMMLEKRRKMMDAQSKARLDERKKTIEVVHARNNE